MLKNNEQDLLSFITSALKPYSIVLVGYSGGVDSTVLLHLLMRLAVQRPDLSVRAVYIHHGLSDNADSWATHCEQQCLQWHIPFQHINVSLINSKKNIEAFARQARYQAIQAILKPNEVLATAQHLDDQCETFLLALKRGSGPAGLSAMPEKTMLARHAHIRPLLNISRQQIEAYARHFQLSWIEDESNQNRRFDRNFLRLDVLPLLSARWPHFSNMAARSAELCAQQEQLLDELLSEALTAAVDQQGTIDIQTLSVMGEIKRAAIMRRWLAYLQQTMPTREQLWHIWHDVALAKEDADPCFIIGEKQIRRFQNRLYLLPQFHSLEHLSLPWDMSQPLVLPDNVGCIKADTCGEVSVRKPQKEEKITIRFTTSGKFTVVGRTGSRKIKKLWQEFSIAPWQRKRIPLLFYNDTLIAALSVFVTQAGQAQQEPLFLIFEQNTDKP